MQAKKKELALKLDMLESLARSQRALARIVEGAAEAAEGSTSVRLRLLDHVDAIGRLQYSLAEQVAGIRIERVRTGKPAPPWLNGGCIGTGVPAGSDGFAIGPNGRAAGGVKDVKVKCVLE